MSSFSKLIITNAGKELLNTSFTTGKKIVFTNAVTSAEKHTIDDLKGLSELQAVQCVSLKNVNVEENHIKISIEFNNGDLMEGYLLQTLGVYAKLEDSTEVLFAASKEETENAYIPSKDVTASGISIKLSIYLENAENVKVNIDPAGVATMGDVLSVENGLSAHINDTIKHITPTERNAWNQTYEQGTAYTDQKIADLINGAPETLDTLKEVADAIHENETVVEALNAAIGNKANRSELDTHTGNETIHITANERNNWNSKAQINHASTGTGYGVASTTEYGHVKLCHDYTLTDNSKPPISQAPSQKSINNLYLKMLDLLQGKQEKVVAQNLTATTTGNWVIVEKTGYHLVNAYNVRDDINFPVSGIMKRTEGDKYTIFINGANNANVLLRLIWLKG